MLDYLAEHAQLQSTNTQMQMDQMQMQQERNSSSILKTVSTYVHSKSFTPLADESVQDMFNQDSNSGYLVGRYVSLVHVYMGEAND